MKWIERRGSIEAEWAAREWRREKWSSAIVLIAHIVVGAACVLLVILKAVSE